MIGTDVVELGAADIPEMLDLAARTQPGPFWPRTHELGTYLGIRVNGRLVAMAGEGLRPPGWTDQRRLHSTRGTRARTRRPPCAHARRTHT